MWGCVLGLALVLVLGGRGLWGGREEKRRREEPAGKEKRRREEGKGKEGEEKKRRREIRVALEREGRDDGKVEGVRDVHSDVQPLDADAVRALGLRGRDKKFGDAFEGAEAVFDVFQRRGGKVVGCEGARSGREKEKAVDVVGPDLRLKEVRRRFGAVHGLDDEDLAALVGLSNYKADGGAGREFGRKDGPPEASPRMTEWRNGARDARRR